MFTSVGDDFFIHLFYLRDLLVGRVVMVDCNDGDGYDEGRSYLVHFERKFL